MTSEQKMDQSDFSAWAEHEHEHMFKLFEDLDQTFRRLARQKLKGAQLGEALEQAIDDLNGALEDTLEHFGEEEEVYFSAIEAHVPALAPQISELIDAHEDICAKIRQLKRQLSALALSGGVVGDDALKSLVSRVHGLVASMRAHNTQENEVFNHAQGLMGDAWDKAPGFKRASSE